MVHCKFAAAKVRIQGDCSEGCGIVLVNDCEIRSWDRYPSKYPAPYACFVAGNVLDVDTDSTDHPVVLMASWYVPVAGEATASVAATTRYWSLDAHVRSAHSMA